MTQALDGEAEYPSEPKVPDEPLQPVDEDESLQPEFAFEDIKPVSAIDLANLPTGRAWEKFTKELVYLERRLVDKEMIEGLRLDGFTGPAYDRFEDALARYGLGVSQAWLHNGHFFSVAAKHGYGVAFDDTDLTLLHFDRTARSSLSNMIVGRTLPKFRQQALVEGGWNYELAGINTYFMGATVFCFPNEYRSWQATIRRWGRSDRAEEQCAVREGSDEANEIAMWIKEALPTLKPEKHRLLVLDLLGYTNAQIGERLGLSDRAVEGQLARLREKCRKLLDPKGGHRDRAADNN